LSIFFSGYIIKKYYVKNRRFSMSLVDPLFIPAIKPLAELETKTIKVLRQKTKARHVRTFQEFNVNCHLVELLYRRKMSLRDLAKEMGVSVSTLSRLNTSYKGTVRALNLKTLARICKALKCDFNDLITINREPDLSKEKELQILIDRAFDLGYTKALEDANKSYESRISLKNTLRL
jgi:putative transcriptional regulator